MVTLDDPDRLRVLGETGLLDSPRETYFDRVTHLAARLVGAPTALISLVDGHRLFFKSEQGLAEPWASRREAPLSHSLCPRVATSAAVVAIDDVATDPRAAGSRAIAELGIGAYLGVPLILADGACLGALCTIDSRPRAWEPRDVAVLRELATLVVDEAEVRRHLRVVTVDDDLGAQFAQERQSRLLSTILESMEDAVVVADAAGRVVLHNLAARILLGEAVADGRDEAWVARAGLFLPDRVTPAPPRELPLMRAVGGEVLRDVELYLSSARAPARWFSANASPLRDPVGRILGGVVVARDVTEAKAMAAALAREHADLRLLLEVATRVNAAASADEAFGAVIAPICRGVGWPVGNVVVRERGRLVPTAAWYLGDDRFAKFRAASEEMPIVRDELFGATGPVVLCDLPEQPGFTRRLVAAEVGLHTGCFAPILIGTEVAAVLELYTDARLGPDASLGIVPQTAVLLGRAIERDRAARAAGEHARALEELSHRDELTGVYNRRGFVVMASALIAMARRKRRDACLLYFDLDGLKRANDVHGHAAGDVLIRDAATVLKSNFRDIDVVARIGGDELVVLCAETAPVALTGILDRIGAKVAERNRGCDGAQLAWSVGVAAFDPDQPRSIEELLAAADTAMFADKTRRRAGR